MKSAQRSLLRPAAWIVAAGLLTQTIGAAAPAAISTAPELFAGEMEDVGPQYLLLEKPRVRALEAWADLELTATSNATLVESDPTSSTITSAQAGVTWHGATREWRGGQLGWEVGAKVQSYRYGFITGPNQQVNFLEIDRNDFDLIGIHLRGDWRRGGWFAAGAFRGMSLRSRATDHVFYEELDLEWQVFRTWSPTARRTFALGIEGAGRVSRTDSFGLLPEGWNDRVEQGIVVVFDQAMGLRWHLQPAIRVLATRYTHSGRHRTDWHENGRVTLSYSLARNFDLRLAVGYDQRDSSERWIADFRKWDLGLAANAHWRF